MAETSWPSAAPATITEHMHELLWSSYYQSGLVGDAGDPALVFADSTGLQVKFRADRYAQVRGFSWHSGDTDVAVPITPNASGQTRIDRAVLELDRSTWQVRGKVVAGTPGLGEPALTVDPGPTGLWQLWVGNVTVPDGADTITPSQVQDRTTYLGPQLLIASGNDLPDTNVPDVFLRYRPDDGRLILHTQGGPTTGQKVIHSDTGWVQLGGAASGWDTLQSSYIRRKGDVVSCRFGNYRRTGSDLSSGADSRLLSGSIPSDFRPGPPQGVDILFFLDPPGAANSRACRAVLYRTGHSSRASQLWVTGHAGIPNNSVVWGVSTSWMVGG